MGYNRPGRPSRRNVVRVVVAAVQLALAATAASGQPPADQDRGRTPSPPEAQSVQSSDPHSAAARPRGETEIDSIFGADADLDGVPDLLDRCPATPPGVTVDAGGCTARAGDWLLGPRGLAVGAAILVGLLTVRVFVRRRGRVGEEDTTIPPLVFPGTIGRRDHEGPLDAVRIHGAQTGRPAGVPLIEEAHAPAAAPPDPLREVAPSPSDGRFVSRPVDVSTPRSLEPVQIRSRRVEDSAGPESASDQGGDISETELVDARTVRFYRPVSGTMQLLPGRLEIVSGAEPGHTIRFVRLPGVPPEVTFGRARGTPPLHVQLLLPTVSRRHARMRYTEDGWRIMNLSRTNPLVVNGEVLESETESRKLCDGDRIEMGEIVFVFRER